mgnify:CR=1 FL=1
MAKVAILSLKMLTYIERSLYIDKHFLPTFYWLFVFLPFFIIEWKQNILLKNNKSPVLLFVIYFTKTRLSCAFVRQSGTFFNFHFLLLVSFSLISWANFSNFSVVISRILAILLISKVNRPSLSRGIS